MVTQLTQLSIVELEAGMYVERMDCDAYGSTFSPQGFVIKNHQEILELDRLCKFVWVDLKKSAILKALNTDLSLKPIMRKCKAIQAEKKTTIEKKSIFNANSKNTAVKQGAFEAHPQRTKSQTPRKNICASKYNSTQTRSTTTVKKGAALQQLIIGSLAILGACILTSMYL